MTEPEAPARRAQKRGFSPLLGLGILVLALVLAGAGWLVWLYWGSTLQPARAAADQVASLREQWRDAGETGPLVDAPEAGTPNWILKIPALGDGWEWPVAVGVTDDVLAASIGWYPETSQPGQVGNFAVAGQCATGAQPFRHLRDLRVGDEILVEGAVATHTYTLISAPAELTVGSDESWVLDPVPGQDAVEPTQAFITLTTCEDLFPTPDRSVGFGVLTATEER